jgi:hypothetical protein
MAKIEKIDCKKIGLELINISPHVTPEMRKEWCFITGKSEQTIRRYLNGDCRCPIIADHLLSFFKSKIKQ